MGELTLNDAMLDDPRVAKAGPTGLALHIAGLLWCSRNNTDQIPWERVACLIDLSGLSIDPANPAGVAGGTRSMAGEDGGNPHLIANHLVEVGLWGVVTIDKVIHEGTPREETIDSVEAFRVLDFTPRRHSAPEGNGVVVSLHPSKH